MTPHQFAPTLSAFDEALKDAANGPHFWGVDNFGPSVPELRTAAARTGDSLLCRGVEALADLELDRLVARSFVRHARSYLDIFRYPEPRSSPPTVDPVAATDQLRWHKDAAAGGIALYVDVPFCETACAFCTTAGKNTRGDRAPVHAYLDRLELELRLLSNRFASGVPPVTCLYIGGGTGSYLSLDELDRLLATLRRYLELPLTIPMTMEGSPSTLGGVKAAGIKERGFDAVSLGVESFEDPLLRDCRRAHNSELAQERITEVMEAGLRHVNIDLIAGLPRQSMVDFARTLETVGRVRPGAVTFYPLRLHRKTSFWQRNDGEFPAISIVYLMQILGRLYLMDLGYHRSENNRYVSDPQWQHAQNFFTRNGGFDLGLGTRAQSQVEGLCWRNSHITRDYLKALDAGHLPITHLMHVTIEQTRLKHFLLPFKLRSGLREATFQERCGTPVDDAFGPILRELQAEGLVRKNDGGYELTASGQLLETETLRWAERKVLSAARAGAGRIMAAG